MRIACLIVLACLAACSRAPSHPPANTPRPPPARPAPIPPTGAAAIHFEGVVPGSAYPHARAGLWVGVRHEMGGPGAEERVCKPAQPRDLNLARLHCRSADLYRLGGGYTLVLACPERGPGQIMTLHGEGDFTSHYAVQVTTGTAAASQPVTDGDYAWRGPCPPDPASTP